MAQEKFPFNVQEKDVDFYLRKVRSDFTKLEEMEANIFYNPTSIKNVVIVFTSESIGTDKKTLGKKLTYLFLQSLIESSMTPKAIILLNSAITLACTNEETIKKLTILQEQGAKIMVCISSLEAYDFLNNLNVGFEASMDEIVSTMLSALKVITF